MAGTTTLYANAPDGPLAQSVSGTVRVFEPNLHVDLAVMASTAGAATGTAAYSPWGQKLSVTGDATATVIGFQSQYTDPDTGLVDMGARTYDPAQGRFTTRDSVFGDPRSPWSLNQFVYGEDNPVTLNDPDGKCADPSMCPPPGEPRSVVKTWQRLMGGWESTNTGSRGSHTGSW